MQELKKLYERGFALHWLRARSKAPVENGWTTGPRATWESLKQKYSKGLNVGVRLGEPSRLDKGYLCVIDVDVKAEGKEHAAALSRKMKELFKDTLKAAPIVLSGRGNGSQHLYAQTEVAVSGKRLAQSPDMVKVKMPSVPPSRRDTEALTMVELKEGWRLRPAWEISLMGTGQQVVLPPSVHPDTGRSYAYAPGFSAASEIPLVGMGALGAIPAHKADTAAKPESRFMPVDVDLIASDLSDRIVLMIETGAGIEDRSAGLYAAALEMVKAGFSDNEILSVLTDRATYLGQAGYEHAQTKDRARAAEWVRKYTLVKAREVSDAAAIFSAEVVESKLSPDEAKAQHLELVASADWRHGLDRTSPQAGAKPRATLKNIILILDNVVGPELFLYNEFTGAEVYGLDPPWEGHLGAALNDIAASRIRFWLSSFYEVEPPLPLVHEAMSFLSHRNRFHPVREYLDGLTWDGKPRIDTWLKKYMGAAAPEPYLSAVSRKVLCAMVARIYEPGCKFDQVLILEGFQGKGKSTALMHLSSEAWFTDAQINIKDKDAVLALQAHWIVELGELSAMRKAEVDQLKEFISRRTDKIRLPYGKRSENFPRQCIFIGTTNRDDFLKDETGNRRFWPVKVMGYDFKSLARDRDQLLAEARDAYDLGEPLFLEDSSALEVAEKEQASRMEHDIWIDHFKKFERENAKREKTDSHYINLTDGFQLAQLFDRDIVGPFSHAKDGINEQKRAGRVLRLLGYEKTTMRGSEGLGKYWIKTADG